MKNIIILLLVVTTLMGCSNNDNDEDTTIPQQLIGSWQFKGIYTPDVVDENGLPIFTPYENGDIITFYDNNTFNHDLENVQYTGTFSVINGNKLTINYDPNATGIVGGGGSKITLLTDNELRLSCFNEGMCDVVRYEMVTSD